MRRRNSPTAAMQPCRHSFRQPAPASRRLCARRGRSHEASTMNRSADPRPLVAHVMFRFDVGGLENGVVNLINHMPGDAYRHAIIALSEVTDFRKRIKRDDVTFIGL